MPPRPRILVVEDDAALRKVLELRLTLEGFDVTLAADGRIALDIIDDVHPDAAVTDLMMPNLDGVGFCRAVRASVPFRELPIILLTAHERDAYIDDALEMGRIIFMNKPFDAPTLAETLRDLVHAPGVLRAG